MYVSSSSVLPFMNKILEKVVHNQLTDFLCGNNILDIFQSGFRTKQSTESALLKVTNDILLSIDSGKSVALMMLDLTAAFDTLDHAILIKRLRDYVGIKGVALKWFSSYLQDRTCLVKIGNHVSSSALHNQAPEYIKDMLIPYQSQRHLRSSQNMLLTVPRSRLSRSGDRAFSVAARGRPICVFQGRYRLLQIK